MCWLVRLALEMAWRRSKRWKVLRSLPATLAARVTLPSAMESKLVRYWRSNWKTASSICSEESGVDATGYFQESGRSIWEASRIGPSERTIARWIVDSSSRTLPGHAYFNSRRVASTASLGAERRLSLAKRDRKWRARIGISSLRSAKGCKPQNEDVEAII